MTIIQNVACIDLICNPQDKQINFNAEILHGKKINSILVCGVPYTGPVYNPPRPRDFLDYQKIKELSLNMNLVDVYGQPVITDFAGDNFIVDISSPTYVPFEINRVLDFTKCNFSYKSTTSITKPTKLRVYVFYSTQNFIPFSDEINGSITIPVNNIKFLKEVIGSSLDGKKIKKIIAKNTNGDLHLVGKNNLIENLDTLFFKINNNNEFYLDGIEIDMERSFYTPKFTGGNAPSNQTLTFIY